MEEDQDLLKLMKLRILRSFRWREDIIVPLADELEITSEELEEILMNHLDMSSLEALHATFESAKSQCLIDRLHADLRLCWLCNVMNIITEEDANLIKLSLVKEIINGKEYNKALKDGKKRVLNIIR